VAENTIIFEIYIKLDKLSANEKFKAVITTGNVHI